MCVFVCEERALPAAALRPTFQSLLFCSDLLSDRFSCCSAPSLLLLGLLSQARYFTSPYISPLLPVFLFFCCHPLLFRLFLLLILAYSLALACFSLTCCFYQPTPVYALLPSTISDTVLVILSFAFHFSTFHIFCSFSPL